MTAMSLFPKATFKWEDVEVELLCEKTYWGEPTAPIRFRDEEGYGSIWLTHHSFYIPDGGSIPHRWMYALAAALQDPDFGTAVSRALSFLNDNARYK